jgi:hypothetical protein
MWSGLYKLTEIVSKFRGGTFTQTIKGVRVEKQEQPAKNKGTPDKSYSGSNVAKPQSQTPSPGNS